MATKVEANRFALCSQKRMWSAISKPGRDDRILMHGTRAYVRYQVSIAARPGMGTKDSRKAFETWNSFKAFHKHLADRIEGVKK